MGPPGPVRYFVTDRRVSAVSPNAFREAVGRAFATWQAVPTATVSFEEVGFTGVRPSAEDGMTTVGFEDRSDLDERVVAVTSILLEITTGEIVESDIVFNTASRWSVDGGGLGFDVETIALHEIGHLFGLGHSAIGETEIGDGSRRLVGAETIMFPLAFTIGSTQGRTLRPDDVAGVSDLYPGASFRERTGSVEGRIQKEGASVVGAHVVAFNLETQALIGGFTIGADGRYVVAGLEPGPYVIRVEPLDETDLDSFFGDVEPIDIDFQVAFAPQVVVVPAGSTTVVDVQVVGK